MWNLITLIPQALGLANKGLDYFMRRADGDVELAKKLLDAEQAAVAARRDLSLASMSHPLWWIAWALFVFPVGIYFAKIVIWDTVLGLGTTPALRGLAADWAAQIVLGLFGMQVASGLAAAVINRLRR